MNMFLQIHAYLLNNVPGLSKLGSHKPYEKTKEEPNVLWFRLDVPKSYKLTKKDSENIDGLLHDDDKPFKRGEGFEKRAEETIYNLLIKIGFKDFDVEHDNIDDHGIVFEVSVLLDNIKDERALIKSVWSSEA